MSPDIEIEGMIAFWIKEELKVFDLVSLASPAASARAVWPHSLDSRLSSPSHDHHLLFLLLLLPELSSPSGPVEGPGSNNRYQSFMEHSLHSM